MSETVQLFDVNGSPTLSNRNIRNVNIGSEAPFQMQLTHTIPTAGGPQTAEPPPPPPRPQMPTDNYAYANPGMLGSYGMGACNSFPSYNGLGGYGYGMGGYGMGYGAGGMGAMGGMGYGGFNRYGGAYPGDIESRFIQIAEESTRPAFDSIQSVVYAIGSVAMMMENTFFALTSSFRAILGVAENFGRLRSLFAQFWSTFGVLRTLNWIIRKLSVMLGIRTESEFKAWAEAVAATQSGTAPAEQRARGAGWPVLLFFGVIAAAPYIVLRMMRGVTSAINEKLNDPKTWRDPLRAIASYDFTATSPQELSFRANQVITLASPSLQGKLWQSGWVTGTTDNVTAGLVPVNYIKVFKPNSNEQSDQPAAPASTAEPRTSSNQH